MRATLKPPTETSDTMTDGFIVHNLAPDVSVRIAGSMPSLPRDINARVERLWQAARARVEAGGAVRLFNGQVFTIDTITRNTITGHMTEYRRLVAQMEEPDLFPVLAIRSLSVCGVLRCADGVAVGRRPDAAVYQPGMWQLPPAGSVDSRAIGPDGSVDLALQLLLELGEEIGLQPGQVTRPILLCVVEHPGSHVSDCGMLFGTDLGGDALLACHKAHGNAEYVELAIVGEADLAAFVTRVGNGLVPPAREFLFRAGLLDRGLSPNPRAAR